MALPAYQDYTLRAKISEVVLAASACRTSLTETYQAVPTASSFPGANLWGCEKRDALNASLFVKSITTDINGIITVTADDVNLGKQILIGERQLTLRPFIDGAAAAVANASNVGSGVSEWRCGTATAPAPMLLKYLPGSCRNNI